MIERDSYDEHVLSMNLEQAECGSAELERTIAGLFERDRAGWWTRSFEAAAILFEEEFGRQNGDWNRECLANGCNGISWTLSPPEGIEMYCGAGKTDALALCAAMVMAKRKEPYPR